MTADEQVPGDGFRCRIATAERPQLVLSVLIVNGNGGHLLERFLAELRREDLPALWRASR